MATNDSPLVAALGIALYEGKLAMAEAERHNQYRRTARLRTLCETIEHCMEAEKGVRDQ